ncbi:glycoside hydrolase family 99-like domain-containing protein [Ruficoccus sp. ZRK36]|uniref:glycoside hydrolase family 99-like domain-containing protein n=1 Tax=Ruficoccus sp. ZRK36 TaxID=2866311 RepID=UPI001C73203D|nr:glycoside hydrolase family 99-like domain-containing protein [Ruficoccus sp. ZRK36]QYY36294.1 glycoside hydrolase family 99-like domain-containing protein [Ruficoccus sp. ZRK36]
MKRPTICTYYFPNWHVDPRNEKYHGKGWTEWRVAQYATPRFDGHEQPRVPLWGYEDEADPAVMAKKIKAATDHGIDAFIFDWYYDSNGPFRERCLQEGFLPAANCQDIKFAFMWANHGHPYSHPGNYRQPGDIVWTGEVSPAIFIACTNHCIEHYFSQPNYLRVDGRLYFSVFRPAQMIKDMGGPEVARLLLRDFRDRVAKAGLGEVTFDANAGNLMAQGGAEAANALIRAAGFDMCSEYSWGYKNDVFPAIDYDLWAERNYAEQVARSSSLCVPYSPVVLQGWDCSPRTVQSDMFDNIDYPFGTVVTGNTPERFEKVLAKTREFMASGQASSDLLHLSCWNEWTEGSCLEPDTEHGYGYLEAVRNVFGRAGE